MDDNVRRAVIGIAIASTMLLAFSREVRRTVGRMAMRGSSMAMDAADETRGFIGNARSRMR